MTNNFFISVITAAVGAGSAAYIMVSLGESVFSGLIVTIIATALALIIDRLLCYW